MTTTPDKAVDNTGQSAEATYSQLDRQGTTKGTEYVSTFKMLRALPSCHYKNDGNPYDASPYRVMVCELKQVDDGWSEFGEDWQHYYWSDETEVVKVTMKAGQSTEGTGWYEVKLRWVNNPANIRGYIIDKIGE